MCVFQTFAHVYFKQVLLNEVKCFEDFISLMEGIISAHLPALKREAERFICREVMTVSVSSLDFTFGTL